LDRYWRKSRREEEKLRERRKMGNSAQKTRTTIASASQVWLRRQEFQ